MARTISKAKTSRVNRATHPVAATDFSACCRDLDNWPRSSMGLEKDLPPGEQLLACSKTIRKHMDNLRMLGGEIIRDLHEDPSLRKVAADRLLRHVIHADGGPLIHNGSEQEQRSFTQPQR